MAEFLDAAGLAELWGKINTKIVAIAAPVGTIQTTTRTDLGDDWLLANGTIVSALEYPQLRETAIETTVLETNTPTGNGRKNITYYNGTWVATGDSGGHPCVFVATDPTGEWTKYVLSETDTLVNGAPCIGCDNGIWTVVVALTDGTYIYYTTDLFGTWERYRLSTNKYIMTGITGNDGTWVTVGRSAAGYYDGSTVMFVTSDLSSNKWTQKGTGTKGHFLAGVAVSNGVWVAAGGDYSSGYYYPCVYFTTTPSGTWTWRQVSTGQFQISGIAAYDGKFVMVGQYCALYSVNPVNDTTWQNGIGSFGSRFFGSVACDNGRWVAVYKGGMMSSEDGTSWSLVGTTTNTNTNMQVAAGGGRFVAVDGSNTITDDGVKLPTISTDGVYNYIKVKE